MPIVLHVVLWILVLGACLALLWHVLARSDEPVRLAWKWLASLLIAVGVWLYATKVIGFGSRGTLVANFLPALFLVGGIAVGGILLGILWARNLGELLAKPFTDLFDDGGHRIRPQPLYSIAIAQRKQGHTTEALAAIDRQLTRFPNDFQGTLLRAEIEAVDLHDVAAATTTLQGWLPPSSAEPGQQAITLTKLADWELRIAKNLEAARSHLQTIVQTLPETEAAFLAEQRLAHLDFEAQEKNTLIHMEPGSGGPVDVGTPPPVPQDSTTAETAQLVQHLQAHPHDVAARERLALLYAWEYHRADLARQELETLLQLRHASPREIARGLNLLADVEIQIAGNLEAARNALQRLIDLNPSAAAAEQARNRLPFLTREMARHQVTPTVGRKPATPPA